MKKIAVAGILVLVSISTLFRGLYFSYETYGFLAALAALSVLYFFGKMVRNELVHYNKPFVLFGLFMLAAVLLSFLKALNPRENLGLLLLYSELLIVFIVLYDYYHDQKQRFIQSLMMPVMLSGLVCAVVGSMALTGRFNYWDVTTYFNRIGSTFQYANTACIYFAVCCIFAITLANTADSMLLRSISVGMGCIYIYAFFLTGSRGGYIVGTAIILLLLVIQPSGKKISGFIAFICMSAPVLITTKYFYANAAAHDNVGTAKWFVFSFLIAALSYLLYFSLRKAVMRDRQLVMPKGAGTFFAVIIVCALILTVVFRNKISAILPSVLASRFSELSIKDVSILYRIDFDKDALKLLASNWLLGLGGGGWKAMYQSIQDYFYTAVFVHNNYLQVFVESGIIGFISYMAIVLLSVISAIYCYVKAVDKTLKTYLAGLFCSLLVLAIHSSFDFDLSFVSLLLFFWVLFAASVAEMPATGKKAVIAQDGKNGNTKIESATGAGGRWDAAICSGTGKIILIAVSSVLFSLHALYFAGAFNRQIAFDSMQEKNYSKALAYYEEAYRLDPSNSSYAFELAKLYHFYSGNSNIEENRQIWLKKARAAAEKSMEENRCYPAHIGTLVMIYLDSGMPLQALEYAQDLVSYQKYYADNYELLARSYLAAADYYEKKGDVPKVKELLAKCIEIDNNPYLRRSKIDVPYDVNSEKKISEYRHSDKLAEYLKEAANFMRKYE